MQHASSTTAMPPQATPAGTASAWDEAAAVVDVDVSLIEDALLKTPEERLRDNSRVLATIDALQAALAQQHAGT